MLSAEHLALIRSIKDLSQQELANRIGCTKAYISMLENRKQEITQEFYDKWIGALYGTYDARIKKVHEEKVNNESGIGGKGGLKKTTTKRNKNE